MSYTFFPKSVCSWNAFLMHGIYVLRGEDPPQDASRNETLDWDSHDSWGHVFFPWITSKPEIFNNLLNELQIGGAGRITQAKLMGFQISFHTWITGNEVFRSYTKPALGAWHMASQPGENQTPYRRQQGRPCRTSAISSLGRGRGKAPPCHWLVICRAHHLSCPTHCAFSDFSLTDVPQSHLLPKVILL